MDYSGIEEAFISQDIFAKIVQVNKSIDDGIRITLSNDKFQPNDVFLIDRDTERQLFHIDRYIGKVSDDAHIYAISGKITTMKSAAFLKKDVIIVRLMSATKEKA